MQQESKPQIAEDPNFAAEQARASKSLLDGLQTEAMADTANLMTRYGTRLALANGGIPAISAPAVRGAA